MFKEKFLDWTELKRPNEKQAGELAQQKVLQVIKPQTSGLDLGPNKSGLEVKAFPGFTSRTANRFPGIFYLQEGKMALCVPPGFCTSRPLLWDGVQASRIFPQMQLDTLRPSVEAALSRCLLNSETALSVTRNGGRQRGK